MRQDVGVHVCDFGNIVWPELSNENPGKALDGKKLYRHDASLSDSELCQSDAC